jgi:uncharacterized membrane protein
MGEVAVSEPQRRARPLYDEVEAAARWLRTMPVARQVADLVDRIGWPRLILGLSMLAWFAFFAVHLVWRHDRFGTFDHDLGIWDQAVWLLSEGRGFDTVRGLDVFAFHVSPALFVLVPFYWLGAGPEFLNLVMIVALVAGAIPVYRAGEHHLANPWHALVVALAFLVNYAGQWMLHETFHPEVVAITPLLFAYFYSLRSQWWPYALWLAFAVSWKEDVALAAFMLGFVLLVRRHTKAGAVTMVSAAAWFLLATQVIVPALSPEGGFTENLFGDLGDSPTTIAETAATDPGLVYEHLDNADALGYARDLLASYGFVPLLSPLALLIGLPQALINLLAVHNFFWTTRVHYAAIPLAATTIAMVEGVARPRSMAWRRFLLGVVAVGAGATAIGWGITLLSPTYQKGFWPLEPGPKQEVYAAAVAVPPADESVAASYNLVPHLTHRERAYTFPNPWRHQNWGVSGEGQHDGATVEWLVIDTSAMSAEDSALLTEILDGSRGGEWEVLSDADDVLVAHNLEPE